MAKPSRLSPSKADCTEPTDSFLGAQKRFCLEISGIRLSRDRYFAVFRLPDRGRSGIVCRVEGWPSGLRRTLGKRVYGTPRIVGSNPTPSARFRFARSRGNPLEYHLSGKRALDRSAAFPALIAAGSRTLRSFAADRQPGLPSVSQTSGDRLRRAQPVARKWAR